MKSFIASGIKRKSKTKKSKIKGGNFVSFVASGIKKRKSKRFNKKRQI